ncbi:ferredoxin subunit of nitrite reductase and ring-hydroxylating dioxygenase [Thaumarchaeota archaeon SCGC AB-539-E09]|nr:ferredoxin subunit of nitrite reductase and ring-hydroxylating dioxygenase [Thaumarchaeota archaeon SCGC AB-539-E09]
MEKIATVDEISIGEMKSFLIKNKEILIVNVDGEFFAMDNRCSHMGGNLSEGTLEGDVVVCPRHGSRFNVRNGEAVKGPKIILIRLGTNNLSVYPLEIQENDILIEV